MAETASKKIHSCIAVIGPADAVKEYTADDLAFISFEHDRLERVQGAIGSFELLLRARDGLRKIQCGAIIIVPAIERGGRSGQALFEKIISADPRTFTRQRLAIMLDRTWSADAALWQDILSAAPHITAAGGMVDIISRHTAVDFHEGQTAYTAARAAGVRFIRYSDDPQIEGKAIRLSHAIVNSPELAGELTLEYDLIAEPGRPSLPAGLEDILKQLGIFTDAEGLPLRGNLRIEAPASNIRGIFVADEASALEALEQARTLTAGGRLTYIPEDVQIDGSLCAACLTCVRVCPLGAPYIGIDEELKLNRAFINYEACGGCGICAGECPADAISINKFKDTTAAGN